MKGIKNFQSGEAHWNWSGGWLLGKCLCGNEFKYYNSRIKKYCSRDCYLKFRDTPNVGRKFSEDHKRKLRLAKLGKESKKRGKVYTKCGNIGRIVRASFRYRLWRSDVFKRDEFRCVICNSNGFIEADHIKMFSQIINENSINNLDDALKCEELWDINNGRTLCLKCHKKTATYGSNRFKLNNVTSY